MAKYKAYPDYKDSGVEWFDVKPSSWKVTRLKLETLISMGQSPSSDDCNIEGDGWAFLQGNAEFGKVNPIEKQYCPVAKKIANPGDILFSVRAPVGAINLADKNYGIGRGLCSIAASEKVTSPFLWWLLPTYKYQLDAIATGSTFGAVSAEQLGNLCFALPSFSEQSQIIAFLDHETAKIDNLIEKQQQLIDLLKEKRQAVISHAVTKGLNPDVPMKDSGVEWLGEVPEHWTVTRLGNHAIKIGSGKTPKGGSEIYLDEGVLFLRSQNIYDDGLRVGPSECVFIDIKIHNEMKGTRVLEGDILLNITGGSIGRSCIVPTPFVEANVNQHVCILRFSENIREFISYAMKSSSTKKQIEACQVGGNREGLNFEQTSKINICLPPEKEIGAILGHLKIILPRLDTLEKNAANIILLLQERRTALISAAVTGKIDVRDWVAPHTQKAEESEETAV